jgi:hypothetical protein
VKDAKQNEKDAIEREEEMRRKYQVAVDRAIRAEKSKQEYTRDLDTVVTELETKQSHTETSPITFKLPSGEYMPELSALIAELVTEGCIAQSRVGTTFKRIVEFATKRKLAKDNTFSRVYTADCLLLAGGLSDEIIKLCLEENPEENVLYHDGATIQGVEVLSGGIKCGGRMFDLRMVAIPDKYSLTTVEALEERSDEILTKKSSVPRIGNLNRIWSTTVATVSDTASTALKVAQIGGSRKREAITAVSSLSPKCVVHSRTLSC